MHELDPQSGKLSSEDTTLYSLASRPRTAELKAEIEAPAIVRHDDYLCPLTLLPRRGEHVQNQWWAAPTRLPALIVTRVAKAMMTAAAVWCWKETNTGAARE